MMQPAVVRASLLTRLLHRAARKARACCDCVFLLPDFGLGLDTAVGAAGTGAD